MRDDRLYLLHIRECIRRIDSFTEAGRESFLSDVKTQDAVLRNLHTLSESVTRLSQAIREEFPQVEWRDVAGFRNVIVHDYLGVDLHLIWEIVQGDLPPLKETVRAALERVGENAPSGPAER